MRWRTRLIGIAFGVALALAAPAARADGGNFGLGIIIGSPTGVSMKYYLARGHALDAALGGTILGSRGIAAHADYLWHPFVLARESSFELAAYVGLGARVLEHNRKNHDDHIHLGGRAPVGLVFDFVKGDVPLDVFVEVAPVLDFIFDNDDDDHDGIDLELNAGIGARYYF